MMRGLNSFGHGGGKPAGKEGEPTFTRETYSMRERPLTRRNPQYVAIIFLCFWIKTSLYFAWGKKITLRTRGQGAFLRIKL